MTYYILAAKSYAEISQAQKTAGGNDRIEITVRLD